MKLKNNKCSDFLGLIEVLFLIPKTKYQFEPCMIIQVREFVPVNTFHKVVQKDCITQIKCQKFEFGRECTKVSKVMELTSLSKIKQQMGQVGTFLGQIHQDIGSHHVSIQFQVSQIVAKLGGNQLKHMIFSFHS